MKASRNETQKRVRYCLTCYTKLLVDPVSGDVVGHEPEEALHGTLVRKEPTPAVLECSECNTRIVSFHRRDLEYFGICGVCERLVKAVA